MNATDPQRLIGKVGLITGAASGIGKATALRLAAEGARVVISPGAVATPLWRATPQWPREVEESEGLEAALRALGRKEDFATPEAVAATVAFLVSDASSHLNGRDLSVRTDTP